MEENESSLLASQQEPENNSANEPHVEQAALDGVGHVTAEEVAQPAEVDTEDMVKAIAEVQEDGSADQQEENAPAFNVHTAEELKEMTDEQILDYLKEIAQTRPARPAREAIAAIKAEIDARHPAEPVSTESEQQAPQTTEASESTPTDNEPAKVASEPSATEKEIRSLLDAFEAAVAAEKEEARKVMEGNAKEKGLLIEQLKQVVKSLESSDASSLLRTVRDIVTKWKNIGHIPSSHKSLNKDFKALTDEFFSKLNIERELRELDHKHNLLEKEKLCEQAEALDAETSIRKAYNQVQKLRDAWRAIGPVAREESDKIWARFSEAANNINKKFRKLIAEEREKEKENYEKKLAICEEVEAYVGIERSSRKDFEAIADKAQEFVTRWKSIGFAPKAVNDEIYARFRKSIDQLYALRKSFYKGQDETYAGNYKLKEAICEKAEAVMNSSDWRKTSDYLIELQREWKEIGPVAHRQSELIWRRFRNACDTFFNNRQSQKDGETAEMTENLHKKEQVIADLEAYQIPESDEQHLNDLKGFLQRWNTIGMVPSKDFNAIGKKFSELVNKHYDKLNIDKADADVERYRGKVEAMAAEGGDKIQKERIHLQSQIRQAEQAAETLENNINFFSKSKNAEKLVNEYKSKITKAKAEVAQLNKKLAVLNEIARR